jgi:hypothetical protein
MIHGRVLGSLALAASLSGCAHFGGFHMGAFFAHAPAALGRIAIAPLRVGVAAAPAVVTALAAPRAYPVFVPAGRAAAPPDYASREAPPPEVTVPAQRKSLDAASARASLQHVDLGPCREHGLPRGYVHARVTFGNAGTPARIDLDGPEGLSKEAVTCVGGGLSRASMPPFVGDGNVPVGVTLFVP